MPAVIPVIALALGAASGAAGLASSIYGMVNKPHYPTVTQPTPAQLSADAVKQETARRASATTEASQFLPSLQYNTSGGLSPEAYTDLSANFSGNANLSSSPQMQQLIARFLGLDTGSSFGGTSPFGTSATSPGLAG